MAQISFNSVWLSTAVNQVEESQSFAGSKIAGATNISFTSQDPTAVTFSGNNVPGDLKYTVNGVTTTVQGIVSRLFKSGNTYEGFYFVEAGSDYALTSQELTKAFILVWPTRDYAFPSSPGTYSTSSDPVDSALNALLAAQPTLVGITQNEADLTLNVGQTWEYTITFSGDIDAATFTTNDLQNLGTAGVTYGTLTEVNPGVFKLLITATSTGTVNLAIVNGTNISSPTGYSVSTSPQIIDNETLNVVAPVAPTISSVVAEDASSAPGSGDSTVVEGGTLRYVITLSAAGTSATQFSLSSGGTASPTDYSNYTFSNGVTYDPATGKITVPAGVTSFTITVPTVDDTSIENTETLALNVGGVTGTGTILDNDQPTIQSVLVEDASAAPNSGDSTVVEGGTLRYTITLSAAGTSPTQFSLAASGSAAPADYSGYTFSNGVTYDPATGKITVPAGVTSFTITVPTIDDTLVESTETLVLNIGGVSGTGTIEDNDKPPPTVTVNNIQVNEASPYAVFTVSSTAGQTLKLSLQNDSDAATADATLGMDTGTQLQYFNGLGWADYVPGTTVAIPASGQLLVRTTVKNDSTYEGAETLQLKVDATGGTVVYGTATILDDGTGNIYPDNTTGNVQANPVLDDDRAIKVNDIDVNERSPYGVFTVTATAGQMLTLGLQNDSDPATVDATLGVDTGTQLQYYNGSSWVNYVSGTAVPVPGSGSMMVRVSISNGPDYEGPETFQLSVATSSGSKVYGTATIWDDGTGTIYNLDGTPNLSLTKDDDRSVKVSDIEVNEASPYAVFTVTGAAGLKLTLSTRNDSDSATSDAILGTDTGTGLEYFDGTSWQPYVAGASVTLPASGQLLVRTTVVNDSIDEGAETFQLLVTTAAGNSSAGTATILDDGTGNIYPNNNTGATDPTAPKDDDRPITVSSVEVNEASPYAFFTVTATAGRALSLQTSDGTATSADYSNSLQYSLDNGLTWLSYSTGTVATPASGSFLVRVAILQDDLPEGQEVFTLKVTGGTQTQTGTGTIRDDGQGAIFKPDGTLDLNAVKDDDRPLAINNIEVNEASPFAVFKVTGEAGQQVSLALQNDSNTATADATLGTDAGTALEYFDGSKWVAYTTGTVALPASGELLVRTTVTNDSTYEGAETLQLKATPTGGTAVTGTATILDDGTGNIYPNNNSGNPDPNAPKDDDRAVQVNNIEVNEASPYAVFTVSGTAGQAVSLALQNDSDPATANASLGTDAGTQLQYFDGSNWVNYSGGTVTLPASGQLLVRTTVTNDSTYEGAETLQLKVTPTGGTASYGTATILDDGTGNIYPNNNTGNPDPSAPKDDDRAVQVNDILVNEASPYAVFTVSGTAGQPVSLALQNDSDPISADATLGTDVGVQLQYFNGSTWVNYIGGTVTLPSSGQLLVRTAVSNDSTYEGAETLQLKATPSGGTAATGTATILDDGTGNIYPNNNSGNPDPNAPKDDDRAIQVNNIEVNEASPYAVFTVKATAGQVLSLGLQNDADPNTADATLGTDAGTQLQYFDGSNWVNYTGGTVTVPAGGQLLVRTTVTNDAVYEGAEILQLKVTPTGGTATYGTATILDDGTGNIYPDNKTGNPDPDAVKDDDRSVLVNDVLVNEASPYAVFTVSGKGGQLVSLGLQNDTDPSTANATLGTDAGMGLEYYDGNKWVAYTGGNVALPATGELLVRTTVTNDSTYEGAETLQLKVTPTGGTAAYGTATILDDGTGNIYPNNPTGKPDPNAPKDDDRAVHVNNIDVNEASPYAVFTVSGTAGQVLSLALQNDSDPATANASLGTDAGPALEYFNGSAWVPYTGGNVTLPASGQLLVRTTVTNDSTYEGAETLQLKVTPTGGTASYGTATILDDGTGNIYPNNNTGATDPSAVRDDDRAVQVNSIDVNEASPYAVFTVKAQAGQALTLGLQEDNDLLSADAKLGTDTGTQLQYFDGSNWVNYTSGTVSTPASGTLLVRVAVTNDSVYEGPEAFLLRVANTAGTASYGTGTIYDDGTGVIFNNQGQVDPSAPRDDDRPGAPAATPPTPTPPTPTPPPPTPLAKGPTIGGAFETSIPEGTRPVTQLTASEPVTWSVEPGTDGALFKIDTNGKLKFTLPPDYERPLDVGTDNTYTFTVKATNAAGVSSLQQITVHVTDVSPGLPVYFSDSTSKTDRMLFTEPAKANEAAQVQFFRTERTDAQSVALRAWYNPLTGDWFYGTEGTPPPYECYVERPDVVLGRVLLKDQGSFNVHTYLNAQGNTQIVSETAADNLGLLAKGYRDLGVAYQFASSDETANLVGMVDLSQLG